MKHFLCIAATVFLLTHVTSAQPAGKETVVFDNWVDAKKNYKWDWLEKAEEGKVTRSLSGNALTVVNINPKHSWTQANLPYNPLPHFWYYEAGFKVEKAKEETVTGLLLKGTNEGVEVKVLFAIDPAAQSYIFRRYSVETKKWLHLNERPGSDDNNSPAINKYDANSAAYNKLKVQREGNSFLLYINDKLVETVILTNPSSDLNNLHGIGITGKGDQTFTVDHIKFSVFENPAGYKPKELVKTVKEQPASNNTTANNTGSKFLGSIIVSCGPEGYAMTSFKVYEWYGTKVPAMFGPMWEGVNKFLNIGEGKGCKMATYFVDKTPQEAVAAEYKDLDKSIRKKVTSRITGLRIVMNDDGITVVSVVSAGDTDIAKNKSKGNGDIQQSTADMSQFLNKGNGNSAPVKTITTEQATNKNKEYQEFLKKLEDLDKQFEPYGELLKKPPETVFLTIQWKQRARAIVDAEIRLVDNFVGKWGEFMSASELGSYNARKDQLTKMVTRIGG